MENHGDSRSRKERILTVVPAVCAVLIAVFPSIVRKLPLGTHSDAVLGFGCGVLLGISIVCLLKVARLKKSARTSLKMNP